MPITLWAIQKSPILFAPKVIVFIKQVGSKTHSQNDLNDEEFACFLSVEKQMCKLTNKFGFDLRKQKI